MPRSIAYIDGDLVAFKSASAAQKRSIVVRCGELEETFPTRTKWKEWLAENPDDPPAEQWSIEDVVTPEPLANCLHTVKMMVARIHQQSGCDEYRVVVQGDGNFRDNLPLPRKYKGSRDGVERPVHLKACHEYLRERYKAIIAEGVESDDVLAMAAWEGYKSGEKIVQCTIDKDANQCAGWLLNWDKMDTPVFVSGLGRLHMERGKVKGVGRKWLYAQILLGDSTDCYKPTDLCDATFGDVSVFKALDPYTTDKECWEVIAGMYQHWYPSPVTYTAWDGTEHTKGWKEILQMYVDCAHMRRWKDDQLDVDNVLRKFGIA